MNIEKQLDNQKVEKEKIIKRPWQANVWLFLSFIKIGLTIVSIGLLLFIVFYDNIIGGYIFWFLLPVLPFLGVLIIEGFLIGKKWVIFLSIFLSTLFLIAFFILVFFSDLNFFLTYYFYLVLYLFFGIATKI
ncbi:MAG: hypothetical protein KAT32_03580, partial [Candidatus Moranbacteria bacterium]|nr:hypothetical protein [Candidatus Moranbacteria bacterium]